MHTESFETFVFVDTYGDLFGASAAKKMEQEGADALLSLAALLSDGRNTLEDAFVSEVCRRASLLLGLHGLNDTGHLYLLNDNLASFTKARFLHKKAVVQSVCPSFPGEKLESLFTLLSAYSARRRSFRRNLLRDYIESPAETAVEKRIRQKVRARRREAEIQRQRARKPDALTMLAFFSQPLQAQAALSALPVQQRYPASFSAAEYEEAAQKAGCTQEEAYFYHNRFLAYRDAFDRFVQNSSRAAGGVIYYAREGELEALLKSGSALFVLIECAEKASCKPGAKFPKAYEARVLQYAEKARREGFSCVHCYFIKAPGAHSFSCEGQPVLPIQLQHERVLLEAQTEASRAWFKALMPGGEIVQSQDAAENCN